MGKKLRIALLLPNQSVSFGATTPSELLELAEVADRSEGFDAVFVGDNLFARPRLESIVLLSAVAARTRRVRLGVACMASFPLRNPILLAAQWAALDNVSHGRMVLTACLGAGEFGANFQREYEAFGIEPRDRIARLEEGIEVLRTLLSGAPASFAGKFFKFTDIAIHPAPVQKPCPPIWIANNPLGSKKPEVIRRAFERVGRLADGWMSVGVTPEQFGSSWQTIRASAHANGRDSARMESCLYYSINIGDDEERAYEESQKFLSAYYRSPTTIAMQTIKLWVAGGPPERCAEKIRAYVDAGAQMVSLRFTSYDQAEQIRRFISEVLPKL
jgi:alkanesulfonate monooxygenase SsuD/methylene tetrahydromethanopterin reductase-like flavin-dependent oxidoreductase (luciferase family)